MEDIKSVNDIVETETISTENNQKVVNVDESSDEDFAKAFDEEISSEPLVDNQQSEIVENTTVEDKDKDKKEDENNPSTPSVNDEDNTENNFVPPTAEQIKQILGGSIKAKGKDITIASHDELKKYLELGVAYYDDREQVKPYINIAKTFEKQGIKSKEDINFLIDLANGDKDALAKLIKDKNIELSDIDDSIENNSYEANDYSINEQELAIENHLNNISKNTSYDETLSVLSNIDDTSKQFISNNPDFIEVLDTHIGNGVYKTIQDEMYKMKSLGQLTGGSELDNYVKVGEMLFKNDSVNQQKEKKPDGNNVFSGNNEVQVQQVETPNDENINHGALSDEEFMKKFGHL